MSRVYMMAAARALSERRDPSLAYALLRKALRHADREGDVRAKTGALRAMNHLRRTGRA